MKKPGKCVHFNGLQNDCCEAGVNYKELQARGPGTLPCGFATPRADKEPPKCDRFRGPTPEEIEADKKWLEERIDKQRKVAPIVIAMKAQCKLPGKGKAKFKAAIETFDCSACGGKQTLRICISGHNGHSLGRCSTPDCVSWIE